MNERKRILVVDDEDAVVLVLRNSLKKLGDEYEIVTARNGREALERVQESPFDLIITDLKMPGMNGIHLTEAIRAQSPSTTVIWATAYDNPQIESEAERLGIHRYLPKPLDINEIRHIARAALETIHEQKDGVPPVQADDRVRACLDELQAETGAYSSFLLTTSGQVMDVVGSTQDLDVATLSALMAGNFLAAHEIARLLGQTNTFKVSYHESDQYKVYAYGVGEDFLLVIVFGQETRPGVVWLYARRAADELAPFLADQQRVGRLEEVLDADFGVDLQRELDDLFQTSSGDRPGPAQNLATPVFPNWSNGRPHPVESDGGSDSPDLLLSFQDAVSRGLVSFDE